MNRMKRISLVLCIPLLLLVPPSPPLYTIHQISLPPEMNKQVCISGMKYLNGKLYLASERCPLLVAADPATGAILQSLPLQVPHEFEMEGLTSYGDKLFFVSENIAAVYEADPASGVLREISTSIPLPGKTKDGDGMEGIAANEKHRKFYLLRERTPDKTKSELYTFHLDPSRAGTAPALVYESVISLPLQNAQWRYSDICFDAENNRLLCLKSYSKGKQRLQYLEAMAVDAEGKLLPASLTNIPVEKFSEISNDYKDQDYSLNLEGITLDEKGNIFVVSDNTSGKAQCDRPAKEKTILLELKKQ